MGKITRYELVRELQLARELIDRLLEATKRGAFDPCDCSHADCEHALIMEADSPACMMRPCLVAGCDCIDFDDVGQQVTEFRRKTRLAEADQRRLEDEGLVRRAA